MSLRETENVFVVVWKIKSFSQFECMLYASGDVKTPAFTVCNHENSFELEYILSANNCMLCVQRTDFKNIKDVIEVQYMVEITYYDETLLRTEKLTKKFSPASYYNLHSVTRLNIKEIFQKKYLKSDCLTFSVYIWNSPENIANSKKITFTSELREMESCSLIWKISNLNMCCEKSRVLLFPSGIQYPIQLQCSDDEEIKLVINSSETENYLKCYLNLKRHLRKELVIEKFKYDITKEKWEFPLYRKETNSDNGGIYLFIKLSILEIVTSSNIETVAEESSNDNANNDVSSLLYDFGRMYIDKKKTDIEFKVEGNILSAHKFVLVARSPVFATMLEQEMLEKKTNAICIEDISYKTLNELLLYLYTGELENINYENAVELINAAEKYQITPLKIKCSSFLQCSVNTENVCKLLIISELVNDENLKLASFEFFKKHLKELLVSGCWKELSSNNKDLAIELLTSTVMDI